MSGRTVPRFVPVGLLAVALAAPAVAQDGGFQDPRNSDPAPTSRPVAPMPRAKSPRLRDFYGMRSGLAAPEARDLRPATAPRPTKIPNITSYQDGGFQTPTNSDNLLPPAESKAPDSYFVDPFTPRSWHARVAPPPAVLAIGTRGLERVGPGADPHGAAVVVKCKETRVGTLVFGSDIVGSCEGPHDAPLPPCESINWTFPIQNVVKYNHEAKQAVPTQFASAKTNAPASGLSGTWYREQPGVVISATFTHDELKLCMVQAADGDTATFTITAHYTLTKDGLVYGAVTGTDADTKRAPGKASNVPLSMDLAEVTMTLQAFVDAPFSFRTKMTSAGLMVSGLKCGSPLSGGETDVFGGMFKFAKDGRVPAPVPLNTDTNKPDVSLGSALGAALGAAVGAPTGTVGGRPVPISEPGTLPLECPRVGIDFTPAVVSPPVRPVMPPAAGTAPRTACEPAAPDTMKSLVSEAFGQMLQKSGPGRLTLPSPRYLEHYPQYFEPNPAFSLPRELAMEEEAVRRAGATVPARPVASPEPLAKPGVVGTWYRDVAGKQCVVKVSPDHLTLTVNEAHEEDGKVSVASLVITADYHMTRDGVTAVGLITSVDVNFEGEFPQEDSKPFFEMLGELQKTLEDKPFALTFRPYGDSLVVGNVRMPTVSDRMDVQPAGYMAGRYKSAGDKLPKPKPTKVTDPAMRPAPDLLGTPTLPGKPAAVPSLAIPPASAYPQPDRVPTAPAPTGDLLPPQALPAPRIVPSGGSWTPTMQQPTPPVPQMQQPTPPDVSSLEKKPVATEMAMGWQTRIVELPDPVRNGRMSPGIVGQLFLYGGPKLEFVPADGTLTVDLIDETPRKPGQEAAKPERWQFSKEILGKLVSQDATFGKSYVIFLPWPAYTPDITRVRISARYDSDNGQTLFAKPNSITLNESDPNGKPVWTEKPKGSVTPMSEPAKPEVRMAPIAESQACATTKAKAQNKAVIPGTLLNTYSSEPIIRMSSIPKPEVRMVPIAEFPASPTTTMKAAAKTVILGINLGASASDPNIRMQQLLYQSDAFGPIQNEWRRFWFNDQPSNLTPERIHGGIY